MSVNYNTLKSMKGMAIGTIIPWSGPISGKFGVPKGWLICLANRLLNISDYPELYDIIGNRYGGSVDDGNFGLPPLPGKSLADYHSSQATELSYPAGFSGLLGTNDDVANQAITTQSSNIDLYVSLTPVNTLKGTLTGANINPSTYTTSLGYVERRLGDGHMGSHSHAGSYKSLRITNTPLESCQSETLANCSLFELITYGQCQDNCDTDQVPRSGNSSNAIDDFAVPKYDGGEHVGRGKIPYGTSGYRMARTENPRNYLLPSDDTLLYNETSATAGVGNDGAWSGIYGTTLNTQLANFTLSSMTGHNHPTQFLNIGTGNVATKESVSINNISIGNLTPVNEDNTEVLTITVDTNTPSLQMVYIIKAY